MNEYEVYFKAIVTVIGALFVMLVKDVVFRLKRRKTMAKIDKHTMNINFEYPHNICELECSEFDCKENQMYSFSRPYCNKKQVTIGRHGKCLMYEKRSTTSDE